MLFSLRIDLVIMVELGQILCVLDTLSGACQETYGTFHQSNGGKCIEGTNHRGAGRINETN